MVTNMLNRDDIVKYTTKEVEKLTHKEIINWLIDECYNNHLLQDKIKKQDQIIETQRRRISNLLKEKKK